MVEVEPGLVKQMGLCVSGIDPWPLLIRGNTGTGKSCAALCLLDLVWSGSIYTVGEACDAVMGNGDGQDPKGQLARRLSEHHLIVLDEIGERVNVGDLEYTTVKRVLDTREKYGKALVLITNHDKDVLRHKYDDRIVSRMWSGTVYVMNSGDRRV
jgi:DNA replication protein DnaC